MKQYLFQVLIFALINAAVIYIFVETDWKRSAIKHYKQWRKQHHNWLLNEKKK